MSNDTDGTIDITDLVEKMRSTFVALETETLFAAAIAVPGLQWLSFPGINFIVKALLSWGLDQLTNQTVMLAFFTNTAIRKASQAQDYIDAISAKEALPPTATDAEYEKAEQNENLAFDNFVRLDN